MESPLARLGIVGVLAVAGLGLGGCSTVQAMLQADRPTARVVGMSLKDFDLQSATMVFDVEVTNHYAVDLPLVKVDHALASSGQTFLTGQSDLQGLIPAGQSKTIPITAELAFAPLVQTLSAARPGTLLPYQAELGLAVDAPVVGQLRLPVRQQGQLPMPFVPGVRVARIDWDKLDLATVAGTMVVNITNSAQYALTLAGMEYRLSLAGRNVANQSISPQAAIAPGETAELSIPLRLSPAELGMAVLDVLRGQSTDYRLGGSAKLVTPAGPLTVPLSAAGNVAMK